MTSTTTPGGTLQYTEEFNNTTADEWAEYYGIDTGAAIPGPTEADDEYERFTEDRDGWLTDEDEDA
jgi:hypothetical protein